MRLSASLRHLVKITPLALLLFVLKMIAAAWRAQTRRGGQGILDDSEVPDPGGEGILDALKQRGTAEEEALKEVESEC